MKSQYNFFEIREIEKTDEFANYYNMGFIAPIKLRFKNDWKFSFVHEWSHISVRIFPEGKLLADAYRQKRNAHFYITEGVKGKSIFKPCIKYPSIVK